MRSCQFSLDKASGISDSHPTRTLSLSGKGEGEELFEMPIKKVLGDRFNRPRIGFFFSSSSTKN